jgi:hypothetical protein
LSRIASVLAEGQAVDLKLTFDRGIATERLERCVDVLRQRIDALDGVEDLRPSLLGRVFVCIDICGTDVRHRNL